jgi:hypothetical protein
MIPIRCQVDSHLQALQQQQQQQREKGNADNVTMKHIGRQGAPTGGLLTARVQMKDMLLPDTTPQLSVVLTGTPPTPTTSVTLATMA